MGILSDLFLFKSRTNKVIIEADADSDIPPPPYTQTQYLDAKNGDPMACLSCGFEGLYDKDTPPGTPVQWPDKSVWFNPNEGWECVECFMK